MLAHTHFLLKHAFSGNKPFLLKRTILSEFTPSTKRERHEVVFYARKFAEEGKGM